MSQKSNLQMDKTPRLLTLRRGTEIHCVEGMFWITLDGDLKDHILKSGEKFIVSRKGKVVLQALHPSSAISLN